MSVTHRDGCMGGLDSRYSFSLCNDPPLPPALHFPASSGSDGRTGSKALLLLGDSALQPVTLTCWLPLTEQ